MASTFQDRICNSLYFLLDAQTKVNWFQTKMHHCSIEQSIIKHVVESVVVKACSVGA